MSRVLQHRLDGPLLNEAACVEDADAIAHLRNDAEVVADEEHGGRELGLELSDEVEHLRLDRRIEPCGRLVENEELRVLRERNRDHDPLLHAARELMRIARHNARGVGDLHPPECLERAVGRFAAGGAQHRERLGNLCADAHARVQSGAGALVDHRDLVRVVVAEAPATECQHVYARHRDAPCRHPPVAREVADDAECGRRLAAARLAHEPVRPPPADREGDAPEHLAVHSADAIRELEIRDLKSGCGHDVHRSYASRTPSATRFTATTRLAIARAGKSVIHQYGSMSV